jgi:hypothetical protein
VIIRNLDFNIFSTKKFFKFYLLVPLAVLFLLIQGCERKNPATTGKNIKAPNAGSGVRSAQYLVTKISFKDGKIQITGTNLRSITKIRIKNDSGEIDNVKIETQENESLTVSPADKNVSIIYKSLVNLLISDALGETSYSIDVSIPDGSITGAKLSKMSAATGNVLKYNGTSWAPGDLSGLTYIGIWNASSNSPDLVNLSNPSGGDFYIVTTAGTTDLGEGNGTNSWSTGDWAIYNAVLSRWEKIANSSDVASFNSRTGAITPQANDYTWAQINKTTAPINDLSDVDTATSAPTNGKVLKWNGTNWVPGDDLSGGGAGTVNSTEITDDSIMNVDINTSAAIAQSKIAGLNTSLSEKEPTLTAGTSAQYYRGDKTWQTLSSAVIEDSINNGTTTLASSSNAIFDALALKENTINVTASRALVSSAGGGVAASSVTSTELGYLAGIDSNVQDQIDLKAPLASPTFTGNVTMPSAGNVNMPGTGIWNSSGNVGIGTTNPTTAKLVIAGGNGGIGLDLSTSDQYLEARVIRNSLNSIDKNLWLNYGTDSTGKILFFNQTTEVMRVDSNGRVGIGTTSPSYPLDVTGNIRATTGFVIDATSYIHNNGAGPLFAFDTNQYMRYDRSSDTLYLLVNDTIKAQVGSDGNMWISGALTQASDKRKKYQILSSALGMEFINDLDPVSYLWKKSVKNDKKLHYGFLAQDLAKTVKRYHPKINNYSKLPFVNYDKISDTYSVNYTEFIIPLIKAFQEFFILFKENKSQVQLELEKRDLKIEKLEKENYLLKNYLCQKDSTAPFCQ